MMSNHQRGQADLETIETKISNYLRFGVVLSATVIIVGLIMLFLERRSGYPGGTFPASVPAIVQGLVQLKPYGLILTGLLLLVLTPVFRVAISILAFFQERDYLYVVITSTVFIILIIGFLLGKIAA